MEQQTIGCHVQVKLDKMIDYEEKDSMAFLEELISKKGFVSLS
jgi:hypothetical protein